MEQEQSKRYHARERTRKTKGTLHQKRVRQRRKRLTERSNVYRESPVETGGTNVLS